MYRTGWLFISTILLIPSISYATNFNIPSYYIPNGKLNIPAVRMDDIDYAQNPEDIPEGSSVENALSPKAYTIKMKFDVKSSQFYIEQVIPISNYEYYLNTLRIGSTRNEVIEILGKPTKISTLVYMCGIMGPAPSNLTDGTPYEAWEYIDNEMVYMVWFAGTSDVPVDDWILQGVISYSINSEW